MDFNLIVKFITLSEYDTSRPTIGKVIGGNIALVILIVLTIIATIVGLYALGTKIYGKKNAWKAIIPVYGMMQLFRSISLNPWLAIVCYVPLLGIVPFCIFSFYVPKAFGTKQDYQILAIFCPYVVFNMLGFDPKYEFQYVKGKNVAFKDEFRTVMPEDLTGDALTPASAVNGAAVTSMMIAKESMISRAASAAAEQTRLIREEQEKAAAEEARKKAEEEAKKKAVKQKPEDFNYDIFDDSKEDIGPNTASLNIDFKTVNGKFQSAPVAPKPAPKPVVPAPTAAPTPVPAPAPVQPQPAPAPAPAPAPKPVVPAPQPTPQPAPQPTPQPAPQPTPTPTQAPMPTTPGIQIGSIPPTNA